MSFAECLDKKVKEGALLENRAKEVNALYDHYIAHHRGKIADSTLDAQSAADAVRSLEYEAMQQKRRKLLTIKAQAKVLDSLSKYRNRKGEKDIAGAALALLDRHDGAPYSNVWGRKNAILGRFHSRMDGFLEKFRLGLGSSARNKSDLEDVVREIFGEKTDSVEAGAFAKSWADTAEFARKKFNAAGGDIPKRKDWGLPQMHDGVRVKNAGFEQWVEDIFPKLDLTKMIDKTNGKPFTEANLKIVLEDVYQTIISEGWHKIHPSLASNGKGKGSVASRRQDQRFLAFKSADDWLSYNQAYGSGDPFSIMMGHLDSMARDIAAMEVLGPNPNAMLSFVEDMMLKESYVNGNSKIIDSSKYQARLLNNMWEVFTGTANAPVHGKVARGFASTRQYLQAAQLGSAMVSATTDINFQRIARRTNGLKQVSTISQVTSLLNPRNLDDQKLAVRLGLIAENWSNEAMGMARFTGSEVIGGRLSHVLSDSVIRLSGLSAWTQAGKWAFGMEFLGTLGDNVAKKFDALDAPLKSSLERYGISADDWEIIRATELYDHEGAKFLRPDDVAARADMVPEEAEALANKLLEMVQTETEFAVPSASLKGRAAILSGTRPGTVAGEILRSTIMYKNFSVTLLFTHLARTLNQRSWQSKAAYGADLFISTTIMGALAFQLKEIAKGRDPRDMSDDRFWGQAVLQGGGLAIFGDFFSADVNRFGHSLGGTVAGPVFGAATDLSKLTIGNVLEAAQGKDTGAAKETVQFLKRYTPGNSLWYSRLAFERMIFDQMEEWADPKINQRRRRKLRAAKKDFNQDYWWKPGELTP